MCFSVMTCASGGKGVADGAGVGVGSKEDAIASKISLPLVMGCEVVVVVTGCGAVSLLQGGYVSPGVWFGAWCGGETCSMG